MNHATGQVEHALIGFNISMGLKKKKLEKNIYIYY